MKEITYIEFVIMRHGQSIADLAKPKVFEGRVDNLLTEAGLSQARFAAEWIAAKYPPLRVISSPLMRAKKTAEEVALRVGLEIETDPGLLERHNGDLAGLTEVEAESQNLLRPNGYLPHETVPGGETLIEFRARAESFWSKVLSQSKVGQRILIVSHGQMIAMLFRCFLNLPLDESVRLETGDTGIHCWRVDEKGQKILFTNSSVHLETGRAIR